VITVTQIQQEALAAELQKRRQAERTGRDVRADPGGAEGQAERKLPSVPRPADEHVAWAKRILADGFQAPVADRTDALRILDSAGIDPSPYHSGREPDTAPPGARGVAAAHLEREQAEAGIAMPKSYADRGATVGPSDGLMPGHPEPGQFDRGYVETGHAAASPQYQGPLVNPLPNMAHYVLPDMPYASRIPPAVIARYTGGSPSDR
jgi:hypothetical protein